MTAPQTHVRDAGAADIPTISRILASSWRDAYRGIVSDSYLSALPDDHWVAFLQDGLANRSIVCFLAEWHNQPVGAAVLRAAAIDKLPGHGELSCLYVLPGHTGRGVGQALLGRVGAHMREAGFAYCVLDTLADNANAIRFYKRQGFSLMDFTTETKLGGEPYTCCMLRKKL